MEDGRSHLQRVQDEVEEVTVIMAENINKADERGDKLSDLDNRAEELLAKGKAFEKKSVQIKQKKMWENKKMKIIFISLGVVVLVIILAVIIHASVKQ